MLSIATRFTRVPKWVTEMVCTDTEAVADGAKASIANPHEGVEEVSGELIIRASTEAVLSAAREFITTHPTYCGYFNFETAG